MNKTTRLAAKHPLILGGVSAANIGSNFLFQWLVLTMLGPGMLTDALFASMTAPQLFTTIVSSSLTHVMVPLLVGESYRDQRSDAWTFFGCGAAIFSAAAGVLIASAAWWVPLTVPGFSLEAKVATVDLARISLLGLVLTGTSAVQVALSFARNDYIWPDTASMLANVVAVLLLIWFLPRFGVWAAAWISVLRLFLQSALLLPLLGQPCLPDLTRPTIRIAWLRLKPILLGASYYKLDPLVDRYLLSTAAAGSLSLLYLAQQLLAAASQVVSKALAVPVITQLASAYKQGDQAQFASRLTRTLWIMLGVCSAGVIVLWLVGQPLLAWSMVHGRFTAVDARELWVLLLLCAGMLVAGALGTLTAGAFYAQGDTRTPTLLGSLAFTLGIGLKVATFSYYGVRGLALAISVYFLASLFIQWLVLSRRGAMRPFAPRAKL